MSFKLDRISLSYIADKWCLPSSRFNDGFSFLIAIAKADIQENIKTKLPENVAETILKINEEREKEECEAVRKEKHERFINRQEKKKAKRKRREAKWK